MDHTEAMRAAPDVDEIHELVLTSYCLVAPKTLARRAVEEFGAS